MADQAPTVPAPGARAASITVSAPIGDFGRALLRSTWASQYPPAVVAALVEADSIADSQMDILREAMGTAVSPSLATATHHALILAARRAVLATTWHLRPPIKEKNRG